MCTNLVCLYKILNLEFIICETTESVSSRMQPKYVTFVICLILYFYTEYLKGLLFYAKIFVKLDFNFFNIIALENLASIICIKKKSIFNCLRHVIYIKKKEK